MSIQPRGEPRSVASRGVNPNDGRSPQVRNDLRVFLVHAVGGGGVGQVRDPVQQRLPLVVGMGQLGLRLRRARREPPQLSYLAGPGGPALDDLFCSARRDSARSVSSRQRASAASSASKSSAAPRRASAAR